MRHDPQPWVVAAPKVISLVACAYFVFWACAPVLTTSPPVPLSMDARHEFSAGGVSSTSFAVELPSGGDTSDPQTGSSSGTQIIPLTYLNCNFSYEDYLGGTCLPASFNLGYMYRLGEHHQVGMTMYGGALSLFGGGFQYRFSGTPKPGRYLGLQVDAGWFWLSVSALAGARLGEKTWIYTRPHVGARYLGLVGLPVGVVHSWKTGKGETSVYAELGTLMNRDSYLPRLPDGEADLLFLLYGGLGASYRF